MIWRPVLAQVATLQEIETHWTLDDLYDCHEALDVQAEMEYFAATRRQQERPLP